MILKQIVSLPVQNSDQCEKKKASLCIPKNSGYPSDTEGTSLLDTAGVAGIVLAWPPRLFMSGAFSSAPLPRVS